MRQNAIRLALAGVGLCGGMLAAEVRCHAQDAPTPAHDAAPLEEYYGFLPLEIYKLDDDIANLLARDLDGDGLLDLAVINNQKARIELLVHGAKDASHPSPETGHGGITFSDKRMVRRDVPVTKQLVALTAGDFNSDGRADLAYYATPGELVVLFGQKDNSWSQRRRFDISDGVESLWSLDAGDINGDRRDDLVLIGQNDLYLLYQRPQAAQTDALKEPEKLPFDQPGMGMLRIVDLDGDGRNDLTYQAASGQDTFRVRFQSAEGKPGPELRYDVPAHRGIFFADVDRKAGCEFLCITQSGRLLVYGFRRDASAAAGSNPLQFYPLGRSTRQRGLAIGDFNADGAQDVVVSDPQGAQLLLFKQQAGGLAAPQLFAAPSGVGELYTLRRGPEEADELLMLSQPERTIGHSKMADGRFSFPQALPIPGDPLTMDSADIDGDSAWDVGFVTRQRGSAQARDQLEIGWVQHQQDQWRIGTWSDKQSVPLSGSTNPDGLRLADINQDGRVDWVVLNSHSTAQVLLTSESGVPVPSDTASTGLGSNLAGGAVFAGDFGGPGLLVAQRNFARKMFVTPEGRWQTSVQYNAPNSNAKIVAVVPCDLDGDQMPELVLADSATGSLYIQKWNGTEFAPWKRQRAGSIQLQALYAADLNRDGASDLIAFGNDSFAVSYSGPGTWSLVELANYQTQLRDAQISDLVAADLNHDGLADIALVDVARHFIDIVQAGTEGELRHAMAFQVFESKSQRAQRQFGTDPRELIAADVTGDSLPDLVLIAHDRILVYPQDPGPSHRQ